MSIPIYSESIDAYRPNDFGQSMLADVGKIVTNWGAVCGNLDIALKNIMKSGMAQDVSANTLNNGRNRLAVLKRLFENQEELSHIREDGVGVFALLDQIRPVRNILAHGHFVEYFGPDPEGMVFSDVQIFSKKPAKSHCLSKNELHKSGRQLELLRFATLAIAAGSVGDGSLPAEEIYVIGKTRFGVDLDQIRRVGDP